MPLGEITARQNSLDEEAGDLRLSGSQVVLQCRPGSRTSLRLRSASATPPPLYQEMERKTPPWTRPRSADHSSPHSRRTKLAANFPDKSTPLKNNRAGEGGGEEAGGEGGGVTGKPPLPPRRPPTPTLDDIVNIKFQRWFPEATALGGYGEAVSERRAAEPTGGAALRLETPTGSLGEEAGAAAAAGGGPAAAAEAEAEAAPEDHLPFPEEAPPRRVLRWLHPAQQSGPGVGGSTYDDILDMLKLLEKEEVDSFDLERGCWSGPAPPPHRTVDPKEILGLLEEKEKEEEECSRAGGGGGGGRRSGELVTALAEELDERESERSRLSRRLAEAEDRLASANADHEATVKRHQAFIDQLLREKRVLGEQCAAVVKEMEGKQATALRRARDEHALETRRLREKMAAAEKIRRDKWVDQNTKKIKELTVKGLEPELERMAKVHQEEVAELRRGHERELGELEAVWGRRLNTGREQAARDREAAVEEERQAARRKVESETRELEREYSEQRRRLTAEVREEKERAEREAKLYLEERSKVLEEKTREAEEELARKLAQVEHNHQRELREGREAAEEERKLWLDRQTLALAEKERTIREACKKERDRHIETVLRRLEAEATDKEKVASQRYTRLKEEHETVVRELEDAKEEVRRKVKEGRSELEEKEEMLVELRSRLSQAHSQLAAEQQKVEKLEREVEEAREGGRAEGEQKAAAAERRLGEELVSHREELTRLEVAKQAQLHDLYTRVKEAVGKKEETIRLLQKQRDSAVEQCTQLENLLRRKGYSLK